MYLAPRVVALLRASRGALDPLVLGAYDLAIGADNKAHASAQKSVLKVQYASLVERITAVEMDADDAREAADTSVAAANEAAALLAAERRSRAAEVNARVPGLTGAEGVGDLSGARLLRSAENSVPKTQ